MIDGKNELPANLERYVASLSKIYELDGRRDLQGLLVNSQIRIHEDWSFDNLDGGTVGHALYLVLPEQIFLGVVKDKDIIQATIQEDLNNLHHLQNEFIQQVFLEMALAEENDWRDESGLLTTGARSIGENVQRRIWSDDGFRLFLSHKSTFKVETARLKEELSQFGISCFVAHEDIHPTEAWQAEIENALTTMDGFAALMTPDFHDSEWTDHEVGFAFARGVPRIAVMLGASPYGFMGRFQGLKSDWTKASREIAGILIKYDRMFSVYLNELRKCPNWDHANVLGGLLSNILSLGKNQINELIAVYNETRELHGAFAFDGTKPAVHGPGFVFHLNRLDRRKFEFTPDFLVKEVS